MRKAQQKPTGRQLKVDIGAELLSSVREMKAGIRARVHRPKISKVAHARLASEVETMGSDPLISLKHS
jgi:putative transcriptional regulator